jgi:hypothetical protein
VTSEYPQADNAFTGAVEWVRIDVGEGVEPPPGAREEIALAVQ